MILRAGWCGFLKWFLVVFSGVFMFLLLLLGSKCFVSFCWVCLVIFGFVFTWFFE